MGQDTGNQPPPPARPAALLAVRITSADIGQRVTLRYQIYDEKEPLTDLLGYLRSWADGVLVVERESGEMREVREVDLVAAKVIPAKRVRNTITDQSEQP